MTAGTVPAYSAVDKLIAAVGVLGDRVRAGKAVLVCPQSRHRGWKRSWRRCRKKENSCIYNTEISNWFSILPFCTMLTTSADGHTRKKQKIAGGFYQFIMHGTNCFAFAAEWRS